jgi:nitrate reductase delta subunit
MSIADAYAGLARMFDYPEDAARMRTARNDVNSFLAEHHLEFSLASFSTDTPLARIQEEYVALFDFNPATAPYLGHHLFGDNQKKGGYMIGLKQEYGRHGFIPPGNELPDHLSVVLAFLAHLAQTESEDARQAFIAEKALPGIERMCAAFAARQDSPWTLVVEAARLVCTADCVAYPDAHKEVASC